MFALCIVGRKQKSIVKLKYEDTFTDGEYKFTDRGNDLTFKVFTFKLSNLNDIKVFLAIEYRHKGHRECT